MLNSKTEEFYFEIGGMTCNSCAQTLTNVLGSLPFVKIAIVDFMSKKARIIAKKGALVQELVSEVNNIGFHATYIPRASERKVYFSIGGLLGVDDSTAISERLAIRAYIKDYHVNYSTKTITVVLPISQDRENERELIANLGKEIAGDPTKGEKTFTVKLIEPAVDEKRAQERPRSYFQNALINVLLGGMMVLFSGFFPSPLTLLGKLVGLGVGSVTLGAMWLTGKEFYKGAWREIKYRSASMHTLIALGTGSAWLYSMLLALTPSLFPLGVLHYEFLAVNMILGIINLGKGITGQAQDQARAQVQDLEALFVSMQPQVAKRVGQQKDYHHCFFREETTLLEELISYKEIVIGDIIEVGPGERFPVEGIILHIGGGAEETSVNQEILTGESKLCQKVKGDPVFGGSLNDSGSAVYVRATCKGGEDCLTRVINDVAKSSAQKTSLSKSIDKIANKFAVGIISLSALTALSWAIFGPAPAFAWMIKNAMSVLLCACPCALGLVTPISTTLGMYKLFNEGILVRDASALETISDVDAVVFDKTGTLTVPVLSEIFAPNLNEQKIFQYAASVERAVSREQGFDHPIAKCIMSADAQPLTCDDLSHSDQGVCGWVKGERVVVGSASYLSDCGVKIGKSFREKEGYYARQGKSCVFVAIDDKCEASIALTHSLREETPKVIDYLNKKNIAIFMLTGDKEAPARAVARQLGIRNIYFERGSQDKVDVIRKLKEEYRCVAMVGDGLNDLSATQEAHVGIALGSWTQASVSSQITMQNISLPTLMIVANETRANIQINLAWTCFYNLLSLTAATGLLYPLYGFVLNPILASTAMAFSSLFVVLNSSRLPYSIDRRIGEYSNKAGLPGSILGYLSNYLPARAFSLLWRLFSMKLFKAEKRPPLLFSTRKVKESYSPSRFAFDPRTRRYNDGVTDFVLTLGKSKEIKREQHSPDKYAKDTPASRVRRKLKF